MTKMYIDRATVEQALEALGSSQYPQPRQMAAITNLRAALAEPCPCGDRPAAKCPGEWEPGCDLGNNPKYAKRVDLAEPVQEPVAWRTFDGEGGYEYRSYEDNEGYADAWIWRNPNHVGWVEALYTALPKTEPVAWMYKGEPWFDGHSWHETYETTMDKTLAYFKDKNARALCFVEK